MQAQVAANRQLHLESPPEVLKLHKPPSIICACPDNIWLFAYFPAVDNGEAAPFGVIWRRALKADEWSIRESWPFESTAGPVTARWFGTDREVGSSLQYCQLRADEPLRSG